MSEHLVESLSTQREVRAVVRAVRWQWLKTFGCCAYCGRFMWWRWKWSSYEHVLYKPPCPCEVTITFPKTPPGWGGKKLSEIFGNEPIGDYPYLGQWGDLK